MDGKMVSAVGKMGRVVVIRLTPGTDLLEGIQAACEKYQIRNGVIINAIGSLDGVRFCNVEPLPEKKCGYGYGRVLSLNETIELTGAGGVSYFPSRCCQKQRRQGHFYQKDNVHEH